MRRILAVILLSSLCSGVVTRAQQYDGMEGLIHTPSSDMDTVGAARAGIHYISSEMMPGSNYFTYKDESGNLHRYNSFTYYLSLTPFKWVELSYACALLKRGPEFKDFTSKDRHVSVKFQPLPEGKWWPSIAIGGADFIGSTLDPDNSQDFWGNIYISAGKHFRPGGHDISLHLTYRYYLKEYNRHFGGVVGGLAYRPAFAPQMRVIAEWDGCHVNAGIDALLWRHLLLQASLQDGRYFSAGVCFKCYLLKKRAGQE